MEFYVALAPAGPVNSDSLEAFEANDGKEGYVFIPVGALRFFPRRVL